MGFCDRCSPPLGLPNFEATMLRGSVPSVQSNAVHTFSMAPQASIPRSSFDRSHGVKTTFDEGYLVPILGDGLPW